MFTEVNQRAFAWWERKPMAQYLLWLIDIKNQAIINTVSSALMTLFTIVMAIVSIRQWAAIRGNKADTDRILNTLHEQAIALATSAEAAKAHAETAEKAHEMSIESFIQEQRPWIGVQQISSLVRFLSDKMCVKVAFSNVGKTPAHHVTVLHYTFVTDEEPDLVERDREFFQNTDTGITSVHVALPGAPFSTIIERELSGDELLNIELLIDTLYARIIVNYKGSNGGERQTAALIEWDRKANEFVMSRIGSALT